MIECERDQIRNLAGRRVGRVLVGTLLGLVLGWGPGCTSAPETRDDGAEQAADTPDRGDGSGETEQRAERDRDRTSREDGETSDGESTARARTPSAQMASGDGETHPRIERGVKAATNGNFNRARNVFEGMADHETFGHLAEYNLAVIDEVEGSPGDAARHYGAALENDPDFTPALTNLVRLYLRQGRVGDAERIARRYAEQQSDNLDHRAAMLEVKIVRGQYEEVVRQAKSILRRDERNVEAMVAMAKANYWMERFELTKAILQRATELAPNRADIYFLFGLVAMENDENSRAISNFKKAIEYNERFAEAYNNLGLLYDEAGDHEGAAEQFRAAIASYPKFKEAMLNLGNAYKGLGELKQAEDQFRKVLEMDSDNAAAYFNLGVLYLDAEVPGMDKIPRLQKSIEMLNEYKRVARGQVDDDDPADQYIKSAREKIKAEKERQKMMREAQKGGSSEENQ